MASLLVLLALAALVATVALRPHGWGPALGAAAAAGLAMLGGAAHATDLLVAFEAQWRAFATLTSVMTMTTVAERLGLLERLAAAIEPRTRGPVRQAFRVTFALAALVATVFSNDAAVLLVTPTILALLRTVYPRRNPKFLVPFAYAVFAAAGVAPLVVSNPMNLIMAEHLGIGFNRYARVMVPVALVASVASYAALAWAYREVLADEAPALGAWPHRPAAWSGPAKVVLLAAVATLVAYPVTSALGAPVWPVAVVGGLVSVGAGLAAGQPLRDLGRGIAWSVFPFLTGVFVLATALDRIGVVAWLRALYLESSAPVATVGVVSAVGSALLNNHPMSVLDGFALSGLPGGDAPAFAALVGGDLGPRLLPVGSLAALLWFDVLRKHDVTMSLREFVRLGLVLTLPSLAAALLALEVVARVMP